MTGERGPLNHIDRVGLTQGYRHIKTTPTPTPTGARDPRVQQNGTTAGNAHGRGGVETGQFYQDAVPGAVCDERTKKGGAGYGAVICRLRHTTGNIRILRDPSIQSY